MGEPPGGGSQNYLKNKNENCSMEINVSHHLREVKVDAHHNPTILPMAGK